MGHLDILEVSVLQSNMSFDYRFLWLLVNNSHIESCVKIWFNFWYTLDETKRFGKSYDNVRNELACKKV